VTRYVVKYGAFRDCALISRDAHERVKIMLPSDERFILGPIVHPTE
jgi:hypothetical protein